MLPKYCLERKYSIVNIWKVHWLAWFYFLTSHQGGANGILNDFYKLWGHFNVNKQSPEQQEEHRDLLLNVQTQHVDSFHRCISTLSTMTLLIEGRPISKTMTARQSYSISNEFFPVVWSIPTQPGNLTVTMGGPGPGISPSHWCGFQKKKANCCSSSYHYIQASVSLGFRFL